MFEIGAPVYSDELRLGVEQRDHCRAHASSEGGEEEYTILVGLADCGTKHWVSEDALIYTNLLIFSPRVTPDGLIRMDEAVIPIECQYERKYSLSSSSLTPTWVPFMATQAAVETLAFDLRLVTDDWLYDRRSHVFHLGDLIPVEASVHVGHHLGLRVFVNNCVATLSPDVLSQPRHVFIENGCFIDSQLPGSKSQFLPRTQDEKLRVLIDAFRFHNQDGGELYITCQLNAVPANDPEAPQKACTFVNGRWKSANSNDYLCASCQSHGKPSAPGKFGPRGFQKPESKWRSGTLTKPVLEQEARMGPLVVLPAPRSPLPAQELPPVLSNILKPRLYGSQWRSGPRAEPKALVPDTPDPDQEETSEDASGEELKSEGSEGAEIPAVSGAPLRSVAEQQTSAMSSSRRAPTA
ncbi:unnamed protein product [Tetraodon nigroviridis]|uniref:Zona pellucida sperm-binding protein 3 n=1 Tax=Tetraodon nigroviridis TaxID=99883 RepID=Q4T0A6_TETNG|nr:unnamed protein product [Tetraodon nigroviridis]